MLWGDERIYDEFSHTIWQYFSEVLGIDVEAAEHCVAPPLSHQAGGVGVDK